MSNTIQTQHPAVVLRSTYQQLRALLAIAATVAVGLTVAVVVLAINSGATATPSPAAHTNPPAISNYAGHY